MGASLWQASLSEFESDVAAAQPAPAGVAVACVSAALALSLLVKVLRITGKCPELLGPAARLTTELRETADADVAAVQRFIQSRDTTDMLRVPARAAHTVAEASALCAEAALHVTGLIAADIGAAAALLQGSSTALAVCIAANRG